jgi:hypothetical protein
MARPRKVPAIKPRPEGEPVIMPGTMYAARLYKYPEAAQLLDMSLNTLKAKIRAKEIAPCFVGNPIHRDNPRAKGKRISEAEIQRYIMMNQQR